MTKQAYIQARRSLYLQLPNTHPRFSRSDRRLASNLFQRGFSLELVRSALLLASESSWIDVLISPTSTFNPPARMFTINSRTIRKMTKMF